MPPAFKSIFRISPFQLMLIAVFSMIKYGIITYKLEGVIQRPFVWVMITAGILFIVAVAVSGYLENKQAIEEPEETRKKFAAIEKKYKIMLNLCITIPAAFALLAFTYMITPTSFAMLPALLAGIFIGNAVKYYKLIPGSVADEE